MTMRLSLYIKTVAAYRHLRRVDIASALNGSNYTNRKNYLYGRELGIKQIDVIYNIYLSTTNHKANFFF